MKKLGVRKDDAFDQNKSRRKVLVANSTVEWG